MKYNRPEDAILRPSENQYTVIVKFARDYVSINRLIPIIQVSNDPSYDRKEQSG